MTNAELDTAVRNIMAGGKPRDPERFRNYLALFLVLAFIASLPMLMLVTVPDGNKDTITYVLGQISGMATTVVGFYFVSKVGEAQLDKARTENTGKLADAVTAAIASTPGTDGGATVAADAVAGAAQDKADEIKGDAP